VREAVLVREALGADRLQASEKARVDAVLALIDEHLPAIYEKEKRAVQNQEIEDRKKRTGNSQAREQLAEREPRGGNAPQPQNLTPETAMAEAYKWVDQNFPDIEPRERLQKALMKKNELVGTRY